MGFFLQQVFDLLTTETGGLTYNLVLAFSIFGALQAALAYWRYGLPQCRRMVLGLGLLMLMRLVLFAASGLTWQGLVDPRVFLPPLDRAVLLLSLMIIIWLWAFPAQNRTADTASLLLGLLVLVLSILGIVWSGQHAAPDSFSGSWLEIGSDALSILLILIGMALLVRRRPYGWETGFTMLFLLALGPVVHLLFPSPGVDFPGEIRLAQMAGYPLLLALPQRLAAFSIGGTASAGGLQDGRRDGANLSVIQALLKLNAGAGLAELGNSITEVVARAMQADICLFLSPPGMNGQLEIRSGFDMVREKPVPAGAMDSRQVPVLAAAISRGKSLRLPSRSATPDLLVLQQTLSLNQLGNFLEVPIISQNGSGKNGPPTQDPDVAALGGLVVINPYSNRAWNANDEAYLAEIARYVAQILALNQMLASRPPATGISPVNTRQLNALQKERDALQADLDQVRLHAEENRSHMVTLAAMVAEQETLRRNFAALAAENERLRLEASQNPAVNPPETDFFEGELRLALEEIAFLKDNLRQADEKLLAIQQPVPEPTPSTDQKDQAAAIAQELRQPMASIAGYSDFLLGESVGLLGAMQRKFLERIKASTARMTRLVDDLVQLTTAEASLQSGQQVEVDLKPVVVEAIDTVDDQLREKKIDLQVRLPENLPLVKINPEVLQKILVHLLQNAGTVTPAEGVVMLQAQVERMEGAPDYVLLRVADSGGGIPGENIPLLFSRAYRSEHPSIPGLGDAGVGLGIVKALVESQGGRVWVDTDIGRGSVFSVLLPVTSPASPNVTNWGAM